MDEQEEVNDRFQKETSNNCDKAGQRLQANRGKTSLQLHVNPGKTFSDISVTGVSRICNKRCPPVQRRLWGLVLLTCTALMMAQVWDRVSCYLSMPVSVNVRVTRNQTLRFPVVTFCNKNLFNITSLNELRDELAEEMNETSRSVIESWDIPDLVGKLGRDAEEIWTRIRHRRELMITECFFTRGRKCEDLGTWSTIYTVLGVCYQYRLNEAVYISGIFNNLYLKLHDPETDRYNDDSGFKILIHDPRDHPIIDIRTHGSTLEEGWEKAVRVTVREFKTIPTQRWPCVKNSSYSSSQCVSKCFLKALYNHTQCLMPYMKDIDGAFCNSSEEYKNGEEWEKNLLFYGRWSHHNCGCMKQCNEDIYSVYAEAAVTGDSTAKLRVFFQDLTFDEISEDIAYDAIALLCDIGGTLGLLLGASVLTFIEIMEVCWIKLIAGRKKLLST
ncbi:acid-sensing ion channel 1B-like [Palaemon carinicauda]|uniref:acid-sensing ion channel 1B-like n=1 Tax=Palaemon carinicauda TaxID=392227 RepID=UPI0035B613DB